MERDFYNEEFEELIRQKTDQHKMYPSEQVWKRIYNSLHTGRRRFIGGMSILITGILLLAGKELLMPGAVSVSTKKTGGLTTAISHDLPDSASTLVFSDLKIPTTTRQQSNTGDNKFSGISSPVLVAIPEEQEPVSTVATTNTQTKPTGNTTVAFRPEEVAENILKKNNTDGISRSLIVANTLPVGEIVEETFPETLPDNKAPVEQQDRNTKDFKEKNWLQQYASYQLKQTVKKDRLSWQVYFSPTVNYRSLSGGDPYSIPKPGVQYVPIALTHFGNPEDYVNHKPAIGYEAGGSLLYRVTRNLTLKTGLQFNYSSYSIKAYESSNSQQATIALNSFYGVPVNTITGYTNIQNFGGNAPKDLYNHYFQLSVPVGFELRIIGTGKLQFNIAANVQPTYLLNRNSYLLTTDYSDYTKAPTLFRRWNFNGGLEAFLSYKTGGLRWQLGPELRYQLLSTYTDQYPIRENLKQYGLKLGVSKTIW